MVTAWAHSSDQLQPVLRLVVEPHPLPVASISGVAGWSKLPSTAGKPEPQPVALFPLWDLVSYFFRLWFGERNQHINDFFPQKPLNNFFLARFCLPVGFLVLETGREWRTHRGRGMPSKLMAGPASGLYVLGVCSTCWANRTHLHPTLEQEP